MLATIALFTASMANADVLTDTADLVDRLSDGQMIADSRRRLPSWVTVKYCRGRGAGDRDCQQGWGGHAGVNGMQCSRSSDICVWENGGGYGSACTHYSHCVDSLYCTGTFPDHTNGYHKVIGYCNVKKQRGASCTQDKECKSNFCYKDFWGQGDCSSGATASGGTATAARVVTAGGR